MLADALADEWERMDGGRNQHMPPPEATRLSYMLPRGASHPVIHRREGAWAPMARSALVRSC